MYDYSIIIFSNSNTCLLVLIALHVMNGILNDKVINYCISLHIVNASLKMYITIQGVLILCKILNEELWKYRHKFLYSYPWVTYDTVKEISSLTSGYTRSKKKKFDQDIEKLQNDSWIIPNGQKVFCNS